MSPAVPNPPQPFPLPDSFEEGDVFRGSPPAPIERPPSISSSDSSSSSSISFPGFETLANVIEKAVARWARRHIYGGHSTFSIASSSSSSSSGSSSSSSTSSLRTATRSFARRRRKRRLSTAKSEAELTARRRALEEARQANRSFSLYLPPALSGEEGKNKGRIINSTDLNGVFGPLENALLPKRTPRQHRVGRKHRSTSADALNTNLIHDYMIPEPIFNRSISFAGLPRITVTSSSSKGKQREGSNVGLQTNNLLHPLKAWWLDVSSPTWQDLREISRLLHLHPLTLEDILQKDPREKLEIFRRLGYYFISFRAIDSGRAVQTLNPEDNGAKDVLYGKNWHAERVLEQLNIGEANVYLVVFRGGICTFHHTNVSEHIDRVRNRIMSLEAAEVSSSDWIAYGILDSIVDSFFPFLKEIDKEIMNIEDIVFSNDTTWGSSVDISKASAASDDTLVGKKEDKPDIEKVKDDFSADPNPEDDYDEKHSILTTHTQTPLRIFSSINNWLPHISIPPIFRPFANLIRRSPKADAPCSDSALSTTHSTLLRMARTRRLVTSLSRLLLAKSDVVAHIQKRMFKSVEKRREERQRHKGIDTDTPERPQKRLDSEELEVAIYLGDVQDHIYTLQQAFAHYERMLSESHPTYLTRLSVTQAKTKSGGDRAILFLSVVSIGVLCGQTVIACFSTNVNVPSNDVGVYNIFGIVISIVTVALTGYLFLVRHWWLQAKRRRGAVL